MITSRQPEPDWAAVASALGTCLMEVRDGVQALLAKVVLLNGTVVLPGQPVKIDPDVQTNLSKVLIKLHDHAADGIQTAADILVKGAQP